MSILADLFSLFVPDVCPVCGRPKQHGEGAVCIRCQWDMPLTGYQNEADNPVAEKLWGLADVQNACAVMFFEHEGGLRDAVHSFKYGGRWNTARQMGLWMGRLLADSPLYNTVDTIVPVPLHPLRLLRRGYNQSALIAEGVSRGMGAELCTSILRRTKHNDSQTGIRGHDRWENVEGIFKVRRPERFAGRHVLIVDDVFTTGATVCSCAEAIRHACGDCRISIATLAVSRSQVGIKD